MASICLGLNVLSNSLYSSCVWSISDQQDLLSFEGGFHDGPTSLAIWDISYIICNEKRPPIMYLTMCLKLHFLVYYSLGHPPESQFANNRCIVPGAGLSRLANKGYINLMKMYCRFKIVSFWKKRSHLRHVDCRNCSKTYLSVHIRLGKTVPLFTKRTDVLPQDLVRFRSREIHV